MKKGKTILSDNFKEYILSEFDLHSLQDCLLKMFVDIKELCDDYRIKYMMSGGSCLGTIRHKGFIPWDDDIDIMMTREDYNRFRKAFYKKKFENYFLAEPFITDGYYYKMPKIYNNKTKLVTIREEGYRKFSMVSIDLFIIEYIPESQIRRKLRAKVYNFAYHAASVCLDYMYPSRLVEEKLKINSDLKDYYLFRKRAGFFLSHIGGIRFYLKICELLVKYPQKTSLMGVPSAIAYDREILPASVFESMCEGEFCGYKVNIPAGYDEYLKNLYGNYMDIPPVEKREIHVVYEMKI